MERNEIKEVVLAMQMYIESHLTEVITMKQLANVSGYSAYHATRIFKEYVGKTPLDYIRALRLSKAAFIVRDGSQRILDVALDFVFDSHEGFTRAFSKEFGISPMRYRKQHPPIQLFHPYYVSLPKEDKEMNQEKTKTVFVQVVERPARKALIKRGVKATEYFEYCEEVGCDVWGILTSVKEALYEPVGMWLSKNLIKPGTSEYVQGVEVSFDYDNEIPEGFELIELKPGLMMIFQGETYDDSDMEEAIAEVWKHIDKFDPKLYGYTWDTEDSFQFQMEPQGYRGYIEARPVKKV